MKQITKLMLAIAVMAFIFTSCQKEGAYNPSKKLVRIVDNATQDGISVAGECGISEFIWDGKLLTQIQYKSSLANTEADNTDYSYDSKNRISQIKYSDGRMLKYSYDGKNLDKIEQYAGGELRRIYRIEHKYSYLDAIRVEYLDETYEDKSMNPFAYILPDEIASEINTSVSKGGAIDPQEIWYFTNDGNNIEHMTHITKGIFIDYDYQYDKKKNPLYGWMDALGGSWQTTLSKNNMVSYVRTVSNGTEITRRDTLNYTYTYEGNYPISKTWKNLGIDYTETYQYQ